MYGRYQEIKPVRIPHRQQLVLYVEMDMMTQCGALRKPQPASACHSWRRPGWLEATCPVDEPPHDSFEKASTRRSHIVSGDFC
jgi:hypothetical protein